MLYACAFAGGPAMMYAGYTLFAQKAGSNIGLYNISSDYIEGVVTAFILLALISLMPMRPAHRWALMLLWLVRTGIALGAMLAYEAIYAGDFVLYYNAGIALNHPLAQFEFGDGIANTRALVGVMAWVTDSYSAIKVVFSFMGLAAVYIFYRTVTVCLGRENIAMLYVLGLFPSILFWSSLFGKEPIVILGLAIFCYGVAGMVVERKMTRVAFVILGLTLAASIRIWLGAIFLAPLVLTLVMASRTPMVAKGAFLAITVPIFLLSVDTFAARFQLESTEDLIARTDVLSQAWAHGGAAQQIRGGFGSLRDMIWFIPVGSFTALFRPLPGEILNPFGHLAGLENAFLLWLFVIGLARRGLGWITQPVLLWAAATLLVWGMVYGFISYQNLGGGFRYKSQVTPILLMLGLYLAYGHKLRDETRQRLRRTPFPGPAPTEDGARQEPA